MCDLFETSSRKERDTSIPTTEMLRQHFKIFCEKEKHNNFSSFKQITDSSAATSSKKKAVEVELPLLLVEITKCDDANAFLKFEKLYKLYLVRNGINNYKEFIENIENAKAQIEKSITTADAQLHAHVKPTSPEKKKKWK